MRLQRYGFFLILQIFFDFFFKKSSIHAVAVVFVGEFPQNFEFIVESEDTDGRMRNAVEHRGFDGGVVNHILENDGFANLQLVVESPVAQKVAAQATVAAEAVRVMGDG